MKKSDKIKYKEEDLLSYKRKVKMKFLFFFIVGIILFIILIVTIVKNEIAMKDLKSVPEYYENQISTINIENL